MNKEMGATVGVAEVEASRANGSAPADSAPLNYEWQAVLQIGHAGDAIHQASIIAYWANAEPGVRLLHLNTIRDKAAELAALVATLCATHPETVQ